MKRQRVNLRDDARRVLTYFGALCLGLAVFAGTASLGAKDDSAVLASVGDSAEVADATGISSTNLSSTSNTGGDTATATDQIEARQRKAVPGPGQQVQGDTDTKTVATAGELEDSVRHVGRAIGGIPVVSKGDQAATSRAAGELGLGAPCSCDQDCAPAGDQCNITQCIVRSLCSDGVTPCSSTPDCTAVVLSHECSQSGAVCDPGNGDADCVLNGCTDSGDACGPPDCPEGETCDAGGEKCLPVTAGTCLTDPFNCDANDPPNCEFIQRCDVVQLIGWPCDADANFCTRDTCEDDGLDADNSICVGELDGAGGALSACAKHCVGGANNGRRCGQSSDCPNGSCQIIAGGGCDSAAEACYVGPSLAAALGRCCNTGACTETDESTCTGDGGDWYRYRNPEELEGDGNCLCPKYGSGIAPSGADLGTIEHVRPSGLICHAASVQTDVMVYCEDLDGDGLAINFCQKRCLLGDKPGQPCVADFPDCAQFGTCSVTGEFCLIENENSDCGICTNIGGACLVDSDCADPETCDFGAGLICNATDPGTCGEDSCISNDIEGGCEDGFLNIGDDYSLENGSFMRLSQFRFRGGISNLGEDFVIEFWNTAGTRLVDAFAVNNLGRTGTHDWTIEVDCFPNCNLVQLEVPEQNPIIIPPTGYVVMRSPRTVGTINGAASFWVQTDNPADAGLNDNTKAWVNGDPNGTLGTNVFIFELVGSKVDDPLGACCDDAESCEDTLRWECGLCTETETSVLCASTLHDCPRGGEAGSFCQFNRWFGPISHDDFIGGGADLTLCSGPDGLAPCNAGACCDGSSCAVVKQVDCPKESTFLGIATDCSPNCCPVDVVSGSDCACATSICHEADGVTLAEPVTNCFTVDDCEAGQTCVLSCEPTTVTQHRHPYTCHDDFGSPIEPAVACDPANGDADCTGVNLLNTCEQSFNTSFAIVRNDVIAPVEQLFISERGDGCSLNSGADRVGWFELINLVDPTPGEGADDCFILTVGLCCTDPILTPIWPFLSEFINCPCVGPADVNGIAPDFDISNDQRDGFGANSKASLAGRCEDGNYSATFTVPPGEYAYQVNADTNCVGSITPCLVDDDCPGTSCVVPNANYSVVFTVESCQIAACCVDETCIITNELDCKNLGGNFLGGGDQPVVTCQAFACSLGSCCVDGACKDDEFSNTKSQCEAQDGNYLGGVACVTDPCPVCPFDAVANCQQVQTIFGGDLAWTDRNPLNAGDGDFGTVLADDVKFAGAVVDEICWDVWFVGTGNRCNQNVDDTWEIRIYDTDPACPGLPGTELGISTINVRNKMERAGQGADTWNYSGSLDSPITLNGTPGLAGDTYWFEVSCFGESPCGCRAAWSRDHGNDNAIVTDIVLPDDVRVYDGTQVTNIDQGFCENTGIGAPPTVLGTCCLCADPCQENISQADCIFLDGTWRPCSTCVEADCPLAPANDDCASALLVLNVPVSVDGSANIEISGENFCALDDGPLLDATPDGQCAGVFDQIHDDVWYSYTATQCGDLTIESCGSAENDQIIVVYDGTNGCPVTEFEELTCGDDTCGVGAGPGTVTLRVAAGQELLVRIGGWNNEVPGGFIGNPRGNWTARWSLTSSCAVVKELKRAGVPHNILKNRTISIDPRGIDGDNPASLQISVAVDSTQVNGLITDDGNRVPLVWWATAPVNGNGLSPAVCMSVLSKTKPAAAPDWSACGGAVHLTGCPIVPTTTYSIVAETSDGDVSDPVLLDTQAKPGVKWTGDCVGFFDGNEWTAPNGVTSIDDAVAAIKTFQDPNAFNATHLSVTDMVPNQNGSQINLIVNINDVLDIILGFQGQEYQGIDLMTCP